MVLKGLVLLSTLALAYGYEPLTINDIRPYIDNLKNPPSFGTSSVSLILPFFGVGVNAQCSRKSVGDVKVISVKAEKHRALVTFEFCQMESYCEMVANVFQIGDWPIPIRTTARIYYPKVYMTCIVDGGSRTVQTVVDGNPTIEFGPAVLKAQRQYPAVAAAVSNIEQHLEVFGKELASAIGEPVMDAVFTNMKYPEENLEDYDSKYY